MNRRTDGQARRIDKTDRWTDRVLTQLTNVRLAQTWPNYKPPCLFEKYI